MYKIELSSSHFCGSINFDEEPGTPEEPIDCDPQILQSLQEAEESVKQLAKGIGDGQKIEQTLDSIKAKIGKITNFDTYVELSAKCLRLRTELAKI